MTTRGKILKAALHAFSTLGYEGASMRQISETAGVAQGLLHYYFKSKEGLYEAVFEYRSKKTIGHRGKLLDRLLRTRPEATLEEVLAVLFASPSGVTRHDREELSQYVQMVASVSISNDERSKKIVTKYFDPIAHRFVAEFQRIVPEMNKPIAVWCYLFAIGARMQAKALNGRAVRLCEMENSDVSNPNQLLMRFIAAGIRFVGQAKHGHFASR